MSTTPTPSPAASRRLIMAPPANLTARQLPISTSSATPHLVPRLHPTLRRQQPICIRHPRFAHRP
ncbi:hypothetical protein BKA80DRAFT_269898 [Phyllosticta citrichinensis]